MSKVQRSAVIVTIGYSDSFFVPKDLLTLEIFGQSVIVTLLQQTRINLNAKQNIRNRLYKIRVSVASRVISGRNPDSRPHKSHESHRERS